jgi:hypothetical protein
VEFYHFAEFYHFKLTEYPVYFGCNFLALQRRIYDILWQNFLYNGQKSIILGSLGTFGNVGIFQGTQAATRKQIGFFYWFGSGLSGLGNFTCIFFLHFLFWLYIQADGYITIF